MSRVLVVEDEAHLAEGLRFNLEAEGHSVEVVGDGESALERLCRREEKFDAVVLDVMLPGIRRFRRRLRTAQSRNYVPVLMLTARGRPEDVLEGFAAGADDYLPKPFELADLSCAPARPAAPQRMAAAMRQNSQAKVRATNGRNAGVELQRAARRRAFPSTARPSTSATLNCAPRTTPSNSL